MVMILDASVGWVQGQEHLVKRTSLLCMFCIDRVNQKTQRHPIQT